MCVLTFVPVCPNWGARAPRALFAAPSRQTVCHQEFPPTSSSTLEPFGGAPNGAREARALPRSFAFWTWFIPFVIYARLAFGDEVSLLAGTPTPDKSQYTLFNPTPVDLRRPYNTDRPSKTDSPFTIDAGVLQIESDVWNWTLDYEKGVRTRTWIVGNTNFRLGLTNWMDLQVFPQFYVNTRTSGPNFGKPVEHDGFGDTTVRLKINLLGDDGGKLVIGFLSSLKIPTNTGDTGNHVWEPGFEVPVNYSLPWGFTLFAQTRIDVLDQTRSSNMRVQWQNPIGLSRTIVGNLSGYVEFYDAVSTGHNQPWVGTIDTGLIYQVTPNCSIDVNSFFGLTPSAPDYNVFSGFGYRF